MGKNGVKNRILQLVTCVGLLCVIWGGYFLGIKKLNRRIEEVLKDDFSWVVQVDEVRTEKNEFVIEGFAFKLNSESKEGAFEIVLHNLDTDEYLFSKMEYVDRKEVNDYFFCEYDYVESGFVAKIKGKELNLKEYDYEVLLFPGKTHSLYRFNTYLSNGQVMYTNPKEYVPLDVAGTCLEEMVKNGILRVYRPDMGMYVYQYDGNLYWVTDKACEFVNKERTYIDCMVSTTQPNFLPETRKKSNYIDDNLDFFFQNNEIIDGTTNGYRISRIEIPSEYSVTSILTGHRANGEWIWKDNFRIHYQFAKGDMKNE